MSQTPPGWYPDQHGRRRWWDGQRWTEHVQDGAPAPDQAATRLPSHPQQSGDLSAPTVRPSSPPTSAPPPAAPQPSAPWQQPAYQQPAQQSGYQQPAQQSGYQQPAQQPGWQQPQPYQQPSAPPRRKGPLVAGILVVVLLLVGGGVAAFLLLGGDGGDDPDDDPTGATSEPAIEVDPAAVTVLTDYFDGVVAGDCGALDLLTPEALAAGALEPTACESQTGILYFGALALERCEIEVVSGNQVDETSARIAYDVTGCSDGARNVQETVSVTRIGPTWRLADVPGFTQG